MTTQGGRGRGWIHGSGRDLIRGGFGGGDAGGGGLTCEGAGAGVMVAVSYGDMVAEREVAWEAVAAVSPMRRDSRAKISRRRDSRAEGRGSAPGLMPRGFLPHGKRRDAGCNSTSRRLPNVAINLPGGACPADFSPGEITGNPAGFGASKLALKGMETVHDLSSPTSG